MLIICALVFSLIVQNCLDHLLTVEYSIITFRKAVDIYGYAIRPVILLLFFYIVSPKKPRWPWWALIGVNALICLTAFFTNVSFTINEENMFQGGYPVLRNSCLVVSLALL